MRNPESPQDGAPLATHEGAAAVAECAAALRAAAPTPALASLDAALAAAAAEHATDLGASGSTDHTGADGSGPRERIERHGAWEKTLGENLSFGCRAPRAVVCQLLIDDGVPTRGHRANILNPDFTTAGVARSDHAAFRTCCVMDFTGGFGPKRQALEGEVTVVAERGDGREMAALLPVLGSVPAGIAAQIEPQCAEALARGERVTLEYAPAPPGAGGGGGAGPGQAGQLKVRFKSSKQEKVLSAEWGLEKRPQ